jgi:hypothetical protein
MKENAILTPKKSRMIKIKSQVFNNIKNPLISSLPKALEQDNLINVNQRENINMKNTPLFSEVGTTTKNKYTIAP